MLTVTNTVPEPTPLQVADYRFRTHAMSCKLCSTPGITACDVGMRLLKRFNSALVFEILRERGVTL